jgi:hypothetical protein
VVCGEALPPPPSALSAANLMYGVKEGLGLMPWIRIEGDVRRAYEPTIAYSRENASRLNAEEAERVKNAATAIYPSYRWKVVSTNDGINCYVVEGTIPQSIVYA